MENLEAQLEAANAEISSLRHRFDQMELQALAIKGAAFYTKQRCKGVPMDERTKIYNAVAHGIVMGWRKCESRLGIPSEENMTEVLTAAAKELGLRQ